MTRRAVTKAERLVDPLMWIWCWLSYRLVMALPLTWVSALLPFAGYYAHHEATLPWRWSERRR